MKPITLLAVLLLASPGSQAQPHPAERVRDRLWIFTVAAGGNNKKSPAWPGGNTKHHMEARRDRLFMPKTR
jgi:hypothetical protein